MIEGASMDIGVVIVTYNRLEKLKNCLASYERQTVLPSFVCVVDNFSTDGTGAYLDGWGKEDTPFRKMVYHCDANLGGAGGFAFGVKKALAESPGWIWIADDDAYPEPDCLEKLAKYYTELPSKEQESVVVLCAKVQSPEGISYLHRRRIQRTRLQLKEVPLKDGDYADPVNDIDLFSFVGTAVRGDVAVKAGLPCGDFFIQYDDTEYSMRCRQQGMIRCLSEAVIFHDSAENTISPKSWKNYYAFRNKLYTYGIYFGRWHCFVEFCKQAYMVVRYYNNLWTWRQFFAACADARKGRLGKNSRYLPGKICS